MLELLRARNIVPKLKNLPSTELEPSLNWPENLNEVEKILQSTKDGDVARVLQALQTKDLEFQSTVSPPSRSTGRSLNVVHTSGG